MSDGRFLPQTPITHSQAVTINSGPKAYQQHLTLRRAPLIHGQPFEETSFMVGKYKQCQYDIQQHKTGIGLSHTKPLSTSLASDGIQSLRIS